MREMAYEIVYGTLEEDRHSDRLFHSILRDHPELSQWQRRFLKNLAYGTIERCIEMDAMLEQHAGVRARRMKRPVRTVLRMALYEICHMDHVPVSASCNEAVELVKKKDGKRYASFVNGVLRTLAEKWNSHSLEIKEDQVRLSLPEDLMEHLSSRYGKKTAVKIGEAFLQCRAEMTLHIRTDRIAMAEYGRMLDEAGISYRPGHYHGEALVADHAGDVRELPGYGEGLFFVQDESSMLPVLCAGIRPGDRVVDVCGAPGGKAMHALMALAGTGELLVRDVSEEKVARIRENIERMRFSHAMPQVWDARRQDPAEKGRADVVLADVPCSGIGLIGRKPEIKYHALEHTAELVRLQRQICQASAELLKPGGVMVYSTCTIHPAENEENVAWIEERLGLARESLDEYLPAVLRNKMTARGMLQMLPGIQNSDGFFVSRLRKW